MFYFEKILKYLNTCFIFKIIWNTLQYWKCFDKGYKYLNICLILKIIWNTWIHVLFKKLIEIHYNPRNVKIKGKNIWIHVLFWKLFDIHYNPGNVAKRVRLFEYMFYFELHYNIKEILPLINLRKILSLKKINNIDHMKKKYFNQRLHTIPTDSPLVLWKFGV